MDRKFSNVMRGKQERGSLYVIYYEIYEYGSKTEQEMGGGAPQPRNTFSQGGVVAGSGGGVGGGGVEKRNKSTAE